MATRSLVGKKMEDGSVLATYVHNDGYLSEVGQTLVSHYSDSELASELCRVGYLSSLGPNLKESIKKSLNSMEPALYKDVAEYSIEYFGNYDYDAEYIYLFENGVWNYATTANKTFRSVQENL